MTAAWAKGAPPDVLLAMQRLVNPEPPERRWATPGDLAAELDPDTNQTPALDLIDGELVRLLDEPGGRLIVSLPPQQGKALALDTPIPTPDGWTTMGEIRPGDSVIGGDGRPCRVTWVSPVWTGRDCYTVTTGDGERIVADVAHEWVCRLTRKGPNRVYTTADLARPRNKNAQVLTAADGLDLPEADLPIDPYVLGVWLGDGHTAGPRITSHQDDIAVRERFVDAGWPLVQQSKYGWSMVPKNINGTYGRSTPSPAKAALRKAGVLGNKHIPVKYLRASRAQRLALLQGLIDSDGYVMPKGQVEFCSIKRELAEGVRELVYSLGAKAVMTTGRATIDGRDCGAKYRVRFYMADAAHLPRKADRCRDSSVANIRYVKAEPCESVPTVCIEVDSPDHTFLAGRTMLPTHNSTRISQIFPVWALTQDPDRPIIVASYGEQLAERNGETIRNLIDWHDLGIQVGTGSSAKKRWRLDGRKGGVLSAGIGSGMTGWASGLTIIDDPIKDWQEANSDTYRERVWNWWTSVAQTRLAPGAPVVVVLTRWHEDDLAGRLLAAEDGHRWRVINIPAQADHDPNKGESDPLGREPGQYLVSARLIEDRATGTKRPMTETETADYWQKIRVGVGSQAWSALYQGRPSPGEGDMLKREWWREYTVPLWLERPDGSRVTTGQGDELMISVDAAFKATTSSDYVAMGVWLRRDADAYLLDLINERMDFPTTCARLRELAARWPQATLKLVEDKANGPAIIASLARIVPGIVPEEPQGSKEARASAVAPLIEAGNVWLPSPELAPWVADFIEQCAAFPNGRHDDMVDQMTQALNRLILQPLLNLGEVIEPEEFAELDARDYQYSPF